MLNDRPNQIDNQLTCRVATVVEAPEIVALVNRAYRPVTSIRGWTHEAELVSGPRTSIERVLSHFTQNSRVLVLCKASTIVACAHVQAAADSVSIGMLATDPAFQNQGLGKQMLDCAERYARIQFNASIFKLTVLLARVELLAFYERREYVRTGDAQDYPSTLGIGQPLIEGTRVMSLCKEAG